MECRDCDLYNHVFSTDARILHNTCAPLSRMVRYIGCIVLFRRRRYSLRLTTQFKPRLREIVTHTRLLKSLLTVPSPRRCYHFIILVDDIGMQEELYRRQSSTWSQDIKDIGVVTSGSAQARTRLCWPLFQTTPSSMMWNYSMYTGIYTVYMHSTMILTHVFLVLIFPQESPGKPQESARILPKRLP